MHKDLRDFLVTWRAGKVVRSHRHTFIQPQNIGNHSYGVVQLVRYLKPDCSRDLLLFAIDHDVPELLTGDVPYPVKRRNGIGESLQDMEDEFYPLPKLSEEEFFIVKLADMFEFWLTVCYERKMGNGTLSVIEKNAREIILQMLLRANEDLKSKARKLLYQLENNFDLGEADL